VDIDMRPEGHARGHVDAQQLTIGTRTMSKATVDLSGSGESQQLTLAVWMRRHTPARSPRRATCGTGCGREW
jgi:hypothetical protein